MRGVDSRLGLHSWRVLSIPLVVFTALALAPAQDTTQGVYLHRASRRSGSPVLRKNVDLVLVPVTVVDKSDKTVNGLHAQDFTVLDEKTQQQIKYSPAKTRHSR